MGRFGLDDGGWWQQQFQFDRNGDGIPDHLQTPAFDAFDRNGDGLLDQLQTVTVGGRDLNGDGKPDVWAWDDNLDGKPDRWAWDLDRDGIPDRWAWDTDGDGRADAWLSYRHDPDGITRAIRSVDTDGDGKPDLWKVDDDCDGKIDTWVRDRNGDGKLDEWVYDRNKDGKPDLWAYDKNCDYLPDYWEKDTDGDGKPDYWMKDTHGDGMPDVYTRDVDREGRPVRWKRLQCKWKREATGNGLRGMQIRVRRRRLTKIKPDPIHETVEAIDYMLTIAYGQCPRVCENLAFYRGNVKARIREATVHARKAGRKRLTKTEWDKKVREEKPVDEPETDPKKVASLVRVGENMIYLPPLEYYRDSNNKLPSKKQREEMDRRSIGHERWHIVLHRMGIPIEVKSKVRWTFGPHKGTLMTVHHLLMLQGAYY